jgi:hypothetical protein
MVTQPQVGSYFACVASTAGITPLSDAQFRLTGAILRVEAASPAPSPPFPQPSLPPLTPSPTPAPPPSPLPSPVPSNPDLPLKPIQTVNATLSVAANELGAEYLALLIGFLGVLLLFVGLGIRMVRAKLLDRPIELLPLAMGCMDVLTDVSFILLCSREQDILRNNGLSLLFPLSILFFVTPCLASAVVMFGILTIAARRHQLREWVLMQVASFFVPLHYHACIHTNKCPCASQHSGIFAAVLLISLTNLDAIRLLPWRAQDFGNVPSPRLLMLTLLNPLLEVSFLA